MNEQLSHESAQQVPDTETDILARKVEELMRTTDIEVIRIAAEVGSRLPQMGVVDGELVAVHSLRQQILHRLEAVKR